MSSASSWIEWSMSGEASLARRVTPFSPSVASATILSAIRGFFSSQSSTSSVASSETCLPTRANRWITASRSSSVTSTFLPRTSILIGASFRWLETFDATPASLPRQGIAVSGACWGIRLKTFLTGGSAGTFGTID